MTRPIGVLVVDDSDSFLAAAIAVVKAAAGFAFVGAARSGEEAVALAATAQPDLVLMDVRMPGIGGFEAARQIREARPGTVVILISADTGLADPARATAWEPVLDKRQLRPSTLLEIWQQRSETEAPAQSSKSPRSSA
jgi:DNA-binding NarL/FixJ family response regulator